MKITCKIVPDGKHRSIKFTRTQQESLKKIFSECEDNFNGYIRVKFEKPYKPRTTGKNSQNSKWYRDLQKIAVATDNDIETIKYIVKHMAVSRGYPAQIARDGRFKNIQGMYLGVSSADVDTKQFSILIQCTQQLADDEGINLDS